MYFLIFIYLNSKLEDKRFRTEWEQAFPDFNLLLISSWMELWFVKVVPKYFNPSTISKEIKKQSLYCDFVMHSDVESWPCDEHSFLGLIFRTSVYSYTNKLNTSMNK
jgi:hypothetical protein